MPNYTNNEVNQLWFYTLEALTDPIVLVSCVHIRTGLSHEYAQMVEGPWGYVLTATTILQHAEVKSDGMKA